MNRRKFIKIVGICGAIPFVGWPREENYISVVSKTLTLELPNGSAIQLGNKYLKAEELLLKGQISTAEEYVEVLHEK